ncbi:hypothetical protein ACSYAD_18530 [Acaryochloris marina NIES-2412]|uniref:hypothetical protein n=1 Tax=Acaryochloris marina TaxID=155978 RepID=UPI004058D3BD
MPKEADIKIIRPSKQLPKGSLHYRQYQALKKYYGGTFNDVFFQAAWAVLGPMGSALDGASFSEVENLSNVGKHLRIVFESEALMLASGDERGDFAAGPALEVATAQLDKGIPDLDAWEAASDNDDDLPSAPIAGDPFG